MELRKELSVKLLSFSGSPQRWKDQTPFGEIVLSEGCKFLREKEEFQEWITTRVSDNEFLVTCTDGDDETFATEKIQYSALPLDTLKIWLVEGVYLLPIEY